MFIAYVIFFLGGLGFGYAAVGVWKWAPLLFPLALALGAILRDGLQGDIVLKLLLALVITAVGVVLGRLLDERTRRGAAEAT